MFSKSFVYLIKIIQELIFFYNFVRVSETNNSIDKLIILDVGWKDLNQYKYMSIFFPNLFFYSIVAPTFQSILISLLITFFFKY